jgi:uncharacterized protein (DUF488 family)
MNPYTIGHSTRAIVEFVDLLRNAEVTAVADVRAVPKSRTNPQFIRESLPNTLCELQIRYERIVSLGGYLP